MPSPLPAALYRFGIFELDSATGELRRNGVRIRIHAQPLQILQLLLQNPTHILTREEISRELWPDGTFVDYEHGVNSAINRLRDALGDRATSPRFVETLPRRGYRFLAPVVCRPATTDSPTPTNEPTTPEAPSIFDRVLATPEDLPKSSHTTVQTLFLALQLMYLGFYIGALANLPEIEDLFSVLPHAALWHRTLVTTAAILIPARLFLLCAVLFRAPAFRQKFRKLWPVLLLFDLLWSLAPFLLTHHISSGLALACVAFLAYSPFAQRSLILMGAGTAEPTA